MRLAIVNDNVKAIETLRHIVISTNEHKVLWTATSGAEALTRCRDLKPDLILMDLVMPVMDGVEATRKIMQQSICPILIVTSFIDGNTDKVIKAVSAGAFDAVNIPLSGSVDEEHDKNALLRKIKMINNFVNPKKTKLPLNSLSTVKSSPTNNDFLVVIGASSGGPQALSKVLAALPESFSAPVVIIQHLDAHFAPKLVSWLNSQMKLKTQLVEAGDRLQGGRIYIAGTNDHLIISKDHRLAYDRNPADIPYRPSIDVFFESVVKYWRGKVLGVLLTGMGRDGAKGLLQLRERGEHTIAQNQATCAVYGMPKAAAELNAAEQILPLDKIGPAIVNLVTDHLMISNAT